MPKSAFCKQIRENNTQLWRKLSITLLVNQFHFKTDTVKLTAQWQKKCLYENYRVPTSSWGWGSSVDHTRKAGMWFLFLWLEKQIESCKDLFTTLKWSCFPRQIFWGGFIHFYPYIKKINYIKTWQYPMFSG